MTSSELKDILRPFIPAPVLTAKSRIYYWLFADTRTFPLDRFLWDFSYPVSWSRRQALVEKFVRIHRDLHCAHTHSEMMSMVDVILRFPENERGAIVEAGCFKGGSTSKLSLVAALVKRPMYVFDSFEGLPNVAEGEKNNFNRGDYAGALEEVIANVSAYGNVGACTFIKGWFSDTLPHFNQPIAVCFADVDLASSLETCLRHFYPLLQPGGAIFSHDGHLPLTAALIGNQEFWKTIPGPAPVIHGLGSRKLVLIRKPR